MHAMPKFVPAILAFLIGSAARTSETARVGGDGGKRTVTMDCGANAFIVGAIAEGGRDGGFGFNLVRRVKFICRTFNGSTPGSVSQTAEAVADKGAALNISDGSLTCPTGFVANSLVLYAGTFIDRFDGASCNDAQHNSSFLNLNVGGDGGTRAGLICPISEALFKVEARVGDAIDSMKGFCRSFGSDAAISVPNQMTGTANPKPSNTNPLIIPTHSNKSISFTISNHTAAFSTVLVGVTAETDFLGGAGLNPPDFKLELLNPSGTVVATKTFSRASSSINGLTYHIDADGTWKLRITNLKADIGTLNVTTFAAMGT